MVYGRGQFLDICISIDIGIGFQRNGVTSRCIYYRIAGASGIMVGDYLTVKGFDLKSDLEMLDNNGYDYQL